ncbi:MAG: AbrB/MazE/SpoVT family DNA-binding domain-containing protein [Nanoarchaeota archaeon]|nr:AbrB/MazE/SpoVT family DNA-binding domain-containing protein [Nanoarchaeota archaeon]
MRRKVIKQGNNTLTITLPRKWTVERGIKAGDELEIKEETSTLIINSNAQGIPKSKKIHLDSGEEYYVQQVLRNLYNSDIEELELTYDEPTALKYLQKYVITFLGWELLEQDESHCKIKNYAVYDDKDFFEINKKIIINISSLSELIYKGLKENKDIRLDSLLSMNHNIYRFGNYCRKIMKRKQILSGNQSRAYSHILTDFLIISSLYIELAEYLSKNDLKRAAKTTINLFEEVIMIYKLLQKILTQRNKKDIVLLDNSGKKLQAKCILEMSKAKCHDTIIQHYLCIIAMMITFQGGRMMVLLEGI